ncbi:MAG: hypothetical protein WCW35_01315 [Bacteroidota bacterium]
MQNIVAVLIFLSLCFAGTDGSTLSDREVFIRLTDSTMSGIATEALVNGRPVFVTAGPDTISTFFLHQFIQNLAARSSDVFVRAESTVTTLELNVQESSVFYGEVFTESFFGTRKTERTIVLSVSGTLSSNADGKVIWSGRMTRIYTDTVLYADVDRLSSTTPPVSSYRKPELSFFDSIIEPAVVTIASGVAIYLFFTIRS